jgi:hypothetical protein
MINCGGALGANYWQFAETRSAASGSTFGGRPVLTRSSLRISLAIKAIRSMDLGGGAFSCRSIVVICPQNATANKIQYHLSK